MDTALDKEINRLAVALDTSPEAVRKQMEAKMSEHGCNDITAIGMVKSENAYILKRVSGTYRIFPMNIGLTRTTDVKDRKTQQTESHDVKDVIGLFYGPITRGGKPEPFLNRMALWDTEIEKANVLSNGNTFAFKGQLDTYSGKLFLSRDSEFVPDDGSKLPPFTEILAALREKLVPLSKLNDENDKGELLYDEVDVAVEGQVASVRSLDSGNSSCVLEITDLGADIITVWPPDGEEYTEGIVGQRVLVYGYFNHKKGPTINAKAILAVG